MTREECENKIILKLGEIEKIYKEYAPKGGQLLMSVKDGDYSAFNAYMDEDSNIPIRVYRTPDGEVESGRVYGYQ